MNYPGTLVAFDAGPDPVDFIPVDLYAKNRWVVYESREIVGPARRNGQVMIWEDFGHMDDGLGRGGQLKSFEAVFSPLDSQGSPLLMWTRDRGDVIPSTVKYWVEYDINRLIQRRWNVGLREKLAGKINVFMGTEDTFYLEGACEFLKQTMESRVTPLLPHEGRDHFNLLTQDLKIVSQESGLIYSITASIKS